MFESPETVKTLTSLGPSSLSNPPASPSSCASFATISVGSEISIIWTPSSDWAATIAYVFPEIEYTSTAIAPFSSVNEFEPSVSASVAVIAAGSVMLRIWTPSSVGLTAIA